MSQPENVAENTQRQNVQLVTFGIGQQLFGLEVSKVQEVIRYETLTHTPGASDIIEGVIDLRENIIPVIDLQKRFKMENTADLPGKQVIITEVEEYIFGFIVDKVFEVQTFEVEEFEPPPPGVSPPGHEYVIGIVHKDEELLLFLDIEKVLEIERLLETET